MEKNKMFIYLFGKTLNTKQCDNNEHILYEESMLLRKLKKLSNIVLIE